MHVDRCFQFDVIGNRLEKDTVLIDMKVEVLLTLPIEETVRVSALGSVVLPFRICSCSNYQIPLDFAFTFCTSAMHFSITYPLWYTNCPTQETRASENQRRCRPILSVIQITKQLSLLLTNSKN